MEPTANMHLTSMGLKSVLFFSKLL